MADSKLTQLSAMTDVAGTDVVYVVDDPGGTPTSKKATVSELFKAVNTLSACTDVQTTDRFPLVDDPSGTPAVKYATAAEMMKVVNLLTANTTVAKTDIMNVIDDPSGTPAAQKATVENVFKAMGIKHIQTADVDDDEVMPTTFVSGLGLLLICVETDSVAALYLVEGATLTAISANALFSTTKDTDTYYNVYYESTEYKIQNMVGDNKTITAMYIGV